MSAYCCCICEATTGESKAGRIRDGEGVPLCAQCRAGIRWQRLRQPAVTTPALPAPYEQHAMMRASLAGAAGS